MIRKLLRPLGQSTPELAAKVRPLDGYKVHLSVDPDAELVCDVIATPANTTHDAAPAENLLNRNTSDDMKPPVMGDCAYWTPSAPARLDDAGYEDVKAKDGSRLADFAAQCTGRLLRASCTTSVPGAQRHDPRP